MGKRIILAALLVAALSVCAFAGEGSDTIGACKLMPELRYTYNETPVTMRSTPGYIGGAGFNDDWKVREHNVLLQVNYGIIDNLDVFAFVGGRLCTEKKGSWRSSFTDPYETYSINVGPSFLVGAGLKGTFWRSSNGLYVGGGGSFSYSSNNHDAEWTYAPLPLTEKNWVAAADLHAGWHIGNTGLTPYLGVEYRYFWDRSDSRTTYQYFTGESKYSVGPYVGLDYLINERIYLNLEGHMVNRWGGSASVGYVFDLCGKPVVPEPAPPAPVIEPKLEPMSSK